GGGGCGGGRGGGGGPGVVDLVEHAGVDRDGHGGGRLALGPRRDRPEPDRPGRQQLRLVLRHHRRGARAAHPRGRGLGRLPRARLSHDLRGGLAHLQDPLHEHVRDHPRDPLRRAPPPPDLGRALRASRTGEGPAARIRAPSLCVAAEFDGFWPLAPTERLMESLQGPRRLVVYQDSRHSVGTVPAATLGPFPPILAADWMAAALAGKAFASEKWYVEASGRVVKTPF